MQHTPFRNSDIEAIFNNYPLEIREKCLHLRQVIFDTASEETLKWGEPSYLTIQTKSGSMIRLHHYPNKPFDFALYFLCQTTLVDSFQEKYPNTFQVGGNRSLEFMLTYTLPLQEIKGCIQTALTYNL
ncbi:DUF1801 domain-containing protein [bacterium]|jgi:hypothetical protein|nr:DUF1801 domain-containing protein [bacterium]